MVSLSLSIVPRNRAFRVSKSICQKAALKGMSLIVPPMTAPLPKAPHLHPSLLEVTRYRALNPPKQLFLLVQNTFICIRGRKLLLSLEGRCAGKQGRLAYCFTKRRLSITRWPVLLIQTASLAAVWRTVNLHLSVLRLLRFLVWSQRTGKVTSYLTLLDRFTSATISEGWPDTAFYESKRRAK